MEKPLLLLLLVATWASCKESPPNSLTWEERVLVDSLFNVQVTGIRAEIDSLCNLRFDSLKTYYEDSMWTRRIQEVERQLERLQIK